jgi:hypothetical protein
MRCSRPAALLGLLGLSLTAPTAGCGKRSSGDKAAPQPGPGASQRQRALGPTWLAAAKTWRPKAPTAPRYRPDGAPRRYDRKTVFELLDGGADAYLEAGLVALLHVRFRDATGGHEDYEVQVFAMKSPAQARALLAQEKGPQSRPAPFLRQGYQERGAIVFARGRHLVKVSALPGGKKKPAPVAAVAKQVVASAGLAW